MTFEIPVVVKRRRKTENNLAPLLLAYDDSYRLRETVGFLRTCIKHTKEPRKIMDNLHEERPRLEETAGQRVVPVIMRFGDLPQIVPLEKNPDQDASYQRPYGDTVWVPTREIKDLEGWHLVHDFITVPGDNGPRKKLVNWMEKREGGKRGYLRFWFEPDFVRETEGLIPQKWRGRFAYHVAVFHEDLDHTSERSTVACYETAIIKTGFNVFDNKMRIYGGGEGQFKRKVLRPKGEIVIDYDSRNNIYRGGKKHEPLKITKQEGRLYWSTETLSRVVEGNKEGLFSVDELILAEMFPEFSAESTKVKMPSTICHLVNAFTNGDIDALKCFKGLKFDRY